MKYLWTIVLSESFNWRQKDTKGCPFDCGLCGAHRQISCTVLLEVTQRCNLSCRYCFAEAGNISAPDPSLEIVQFWFDRVKTAASACNIQLSGGSPRFGTTCRKSSRWVGRAGFRSFSSTPTVCDWPVRKGMQRSSNPLASLRFSCSSTV